MVNYKKQPEGVLVQKPKTFTPEHKDLFQRRQLGSKKQRVGKGGNCYFDGYANCRFCVEPYSNSRTGEKWIKCLSCKDWAHEERALPGKNFFLCQNCNSDDEYI